MTTLNEFINTVEDTCVNSIGLARTGEVHGDAQIAMVVTTDESFEKATLIATGSVAHGGEHVAIAVRGFIGQGPVDLEVISLGDEVIISVKND